MILIRRECKGNFTKETVLVQKCNNEEKCYIIDTEEKRNPPLTRDTYAIAVALLQNH